jgi:hypothetical protein
MMTRIRMRIAGILRRIANQLDPYDPESLSFVARPQRGGGPGRPKDKDV